MTRKPWSLTVMVILLFAASVLVVGCPKTPARVAATAPDGGAAPGAGAPADSGTASGITGGGAGGGGRGPATVLPPAYSGDGGFGGAEGGRPPGSQIVASARGTTLPELPSPREFVETSSLRDVHFDFDRYEIRPQDKPVLDGTARWLAENAGTRLLIEGHCDERGTNEYNLALGELRARATRDYLVSAGIDRGRITVVTYGEERPLCSERTEPCWAQNRRAHFLVKQ